MSSEKAAADGGEHIPAEEQWLHAPAVRASLDRALAWAAENPPADTDLDELERLVGCPR